MKPRLTVLFLLAAGLGVAAEPEWLDTFRSAGEGILQQMEETRGAVDAEIAALGDGYLAPVPADADDSMPDAQDGHAVAVADGGLLYDRTHARVTYLGNVRLNDARLQLCCKNRLYLRLPSSTIKEGEDKAKRGMVADEDTDGKAPAPAEPAAPAKEKGPAAEPVTISAYDALVDSVDNNILLCSHGAQGVPHLKRGGEELILEPAQDGADAYLIADNKGDARISSGKATLRWTDKAGNPGSLTAENGLIEFNREHNTLYIEGPTHISMPDGSELTAKHSLCVTLHPTEEAGASNSGAFMAQFTSMKFDGVDKAVATGDVVASRPAQDGRPAASVRGDSCSYNGRTGECELKGGDCRVCYGSHELRTQESITLAANGDIAINGKEVTGTYVLPGADKDAQPVAGTFRTTGPVRFLAEDGTVTLPAGLHAEDPANHFSCTGPVVVRLKPTGKAPAERRNTGMINLAVANYGDISTVEASGDVDAYYENEAKKQALSINGEHAMFDIAKGAAKVTSAPGQAARLTYGTYTITTSAVGTASMGVDERGDIDVEGDTIHADLPFREGHAKVDCNSYLKLRRLEGKMEVGGHSKLVYPGGVMTANGPIRAILTLGDEKSARKPSRYPHLSYNYSGVESAETQEGGTLRMEKASMECKGPITVNIAPAGDKGGKESGDVLKRISAKAQGGVAVLGKDSGGRLIRATGDTMTLDGATGLKVLTGSKVTLSDTKNTHTASGRGARVTVDSHNNVRISGERQVTSATHISTQMDAKSKTKP